MVKIIIQRMLRMCSNLLFMFSLNILPQRDSFQKFLPSSFFLNAVIIKKENLNTKNRFLNWIKM